MLKILHNHATRLRRELHLLEPGSSAGMPLVSARDDHLLVREVHARADFAVSFSVGSKPNMLAKAVIPRLNPVTPRWWSDSLIDENAVKAIFDEISQETPS